MVGNTLLHTKTQTQTHTHSHTHTYIHTVSPTHTNTYTLSFSFSESTQTHTTSATRTQHQPHTHNISHTHTPSRQVKCHILSFQNQTVLAHECYLKKHTHMSSFRIDTKCRQEEPPRNIKASGRCL